MGIDRVTNQLACTYVLLLLLYTVFYHAGIKALHVTKQENLIRQFAA